jgi:hypothetical protein
MAGMAALVTWEAGVVLVQDNALRRQASGYLQVGEQLQAFLPPGASVAGPERWWWALHEQRYRAANNILYQWTEAGLPAVAGDIDYVIKDETMRGEWWTGSRLPTGAFDLWLAHCGQQVAGWADASYGRLEVYAMVRSPTCHPGAIFEPAATGSPPP